MDLLLIKYDTLWAIYIDQVQSTMPLSSKLKADYNELINQQLDSIQIDSIEDFDLTQQALLNILQPREDYSLPEKFREKIFFIKDSLQSPEDYVEHESNYNEYKELIRERIKAKITEFQSLSETKKQAYIQNQQEQRLQSISTQQIIAQHRPPEPGSDRHVLSEEQWLTELQANEAPILIRTLPLPIIIHTLTEMRRALSYLNADQQAQFFAAFLAGTTQNVPNDSYPLEPNGFYP